MTDKIFKAYAVTSKAVDADAGIFEAVISTEDVDRQGDIVRASGARLENYLKNPVVLWAHDYSEAPVARALNVTIEPGRGLRAEFQFPPQGTNPHADVIRGLWAGGFLNATSIGFIPLSISPMKSGLEFTEWELLEFSIVPVPANQSALRLALKSLANVEEKRGRVLSAANEKKLREAQDLLNGVLDQLGDTGEEPEQPDGKAATNTDDDNEQRKAAELDKILSDYFETLKGTLK